MKNLFQVIQEDVSLQPYNTFGVEAKARYFFDAQTMDDLLWIIHQDVFELPKLILGGGSNLLLTQDFDGLVLKISLKLKWLEKTQGDHTLVSVMAGENWHEFVQWTIANGLGGLENLSLIPGNVGSAPMQNIGAYGVELKDSFHHLEALNITTGEFEIFRLEDCHFGYRDSFFKNEGKDKYIITRCFFNLTHKNHKLNTAYGSIQRQLDYMGLKPSVENIAKAVISIRRSKLPDPKILGNSGSFFKNPVVSKAKAAEVQQKFPEAVAYPVDEDHMKLAAGWLIEKAGWKGHRRGACGVHDKQALVLVNHGGATGKEIETLSSDIMDSVFHTFGVRLEREVNLI